MAACGGGREAAAPVASSLTVTVVAPTERRVEREVVASGSVAPWQDMTLGVELSGLRVANVLVEPGDRVTLGQALVELDRRSLEAQARQAEQVRKKAEAERKRAERAARRDKEMAEREALIRRAEEARASQKP